MAKFQLNPGETLIGSGMMSLYLKQGLLSTFDNALFAV